MGSAEAGSTVAAGFRGGYGGGFRGLGHPGFGYSGRGFVGRSYYGPRYVYGSRFGYGGLGLLTGAAAGPSVTAWPVATDTPAAVPTAAAMTRMGTAAHTATEQRRKRVGYQRRKFDPVRFRSGRSFELQAAAAIDAGLGASMARR